MDRSHSIALFEKYAGAVALVEVELADGSLTCGSAFHVGDGQFVTARHVVEGGTIRSVQTTHDSTERFRSQLGIERIETLSRPGPALSVARVLGHPDEQVDVAALQTTGIDAPAVPVGTPDEEIGRSVLLEPVLVMGYPRIPLTVDPRALVVCTAEVNAAVKLFSGFASLILSPTARGGFSGGLVLSSTGNALGVISQSLVDKEEQTQLGFLSALRVPEIRCCIDEGVEIASTIDVSLRVEESD
jgi:hypothetical protein